MKFPFPSGTLRQRAAACWRSGVRGYRVANQITHHALGLLLGALVVLYFVFGVAVLALRYLILPNIDHYKPEVERLASRAIGQPVNIATITASWQGLQPRLTLTDVVIRDSHGEQALSLPRVAAVMSWWSVPVLDLRLHSLEIDRPDLDIARDEKGQIFVAGLPVNTGKKGDNRALAWVLSQHEIVIRDGGIRWRDSLRRAPELELSKVALVLKNQWLRHRLALKATPPAALGSALDVRGDFDHAAFARDIADVSQWIGTLYVDWGNTDLTPWKAWFDYPIEVNSGRGAVRAWLSVDHAQVTDLTADVKLNDLSTRLRADLPPLELAYATGRIAAREDRIVKAGGLLTFGEAGHSVSLQNFSLRTRDGLTLPPTTVRETWVAARGGRPEKASLQATTLDLDTLSDFAAHLPLTDGQRAMLKDLSPRGRLRNFSARWTGAWPQLAAYQVNGEFTGLSLNAQPPQPASPRSGGQPAQPAVPGIPGFRNLTGSVQASEQGGSLTLASSDARIDLPGYFHQPDLPFERLDLQAKWRFPEPNRLQFDIPVMRFEQEGLRGSLTSRYTTAIEDGGLHPGDLVLDANLERFDLKRIDRYLPVATPEHLRSWLTGALLDGTARDVKVSLRGNLADFPFRRAHPHDKPTGQFLVSGTIEQGRLNYAAGSFAADGKTPMWPVIDRINGRIGIERTGLTVHADSAQTHNVALSNVDVTLPDMLAENPVLTVRGNALGPLQEYVGFVADSPVGEWIGQFTDETRGTGNARLKLDLQLPLAHLPQTRVQGALQFAGNEINLMNNLPPLSQVGGELRFRDSGFDLAGIKANFLGGPATITGGMQRDGTMAVRAEGTATSEGLRSTYASPATQRLLQRLAGSARYTALVGVRNKRLNITVDSTLQGLALDFPAPVKKPASEPLPLKFELAGQPAVAGVARDEIRMALGSTVAARYTRRKGTGPGAPWEVVSGGIGVNTAAPQPDSGLAVNVNLQSVNVDAWRGLVSSILGQPASASSAGAEPAAQTAGAAGSAASAGLGISQYIDPQVVAARTGELIVMGKKLDDVVVGASHEGDVWQANIDSAQASGHVTWNASHSGRGLGRVQARLARLIIPRSATDDVSELLEGKSTAAQIPGLDIVADDFQLAGKKLGRLEVDANNARGDNGREWRINKLLLENPSGRLSATGKWARGGDLTTSLAYTLDIANAGTLLDRLGYANVLRGGKGRMDGEVRWNGPPFSLDIPSLTGNLRLDIASGQFLKVEPGVAKLLGVLSLQSLPRRLALDFRDVFSQGFAFDGVVGTAAIDHGIMKTDNFKMRSVSATVLMDGTADIAKETQNLHVAIIPEINAGAASVVYGLAVNPVIGLGSFLAQLFLREPLMKAFTVEYQIDGPWKDPAVHKIGRNDASNAAKTTPGTVGSGAPGAGGSRASGPNGQTGSAGSSAAQGVSNAGN